MMVPMNVWFAPFMLVTKFAAVALVFVIVPPALEAVPTDSKRPTSCVVPLRSSVPFVSTLRRLEPPAQRVLSPAPSLSVPPRTVVWPP